MQLTPSKFTRRLARDLIVDARGLAMLEFALVTPLLLTLGLGGLELANYELAGLRVTQIAMTVADNAGRVRTSIDESDINEVMIGGKMIGNGIKFPANGRIILSDLEQRTNTTGGVGTITTANPNGYHQWIRWQRCAGGLNVASSYGVPLDSSGNPVINIDSTTNADHGAVETKSLIDGMGSTGNPIAASTGTAVMFVEVVYQYQPIVPINFLGASTIRSVQAFNVRQRTDYVLHNNGSLSGNARSDCRLVSSTVPAV